MVRSRTPMKEATTVEIWTHPHPQVSKQHALIFPTFTFCKTSSNFPSKIQYLGLLKHTNSIQIE